MSAATLMSRILGLVRTILEAAVLGGNALASEWGFAIIFPNIFRRLLGEGPQDAFRRKALPVQNLRKVPQ